MKRLLLLLVGLIAVAIVAALKIPKRAQQPDVEEGAWELAENQQSS